MTKIDYLSKSGLAALWSKVENSFATKTFATYTSGESIDITNNVVKVAMTATLSPSVGITPTLDFIATVSQTSDGKITATKQTVRAAAFDSAGIVDIESQTFAGYKTFQDGLSAKIIKITEQAAVAHLEFSRQGYNYIVIPPGSRLGINPTGQPGAAASFVFDGDADVKSFRPGTKNLYSLGTIALQWKNICGETIYEDGVTLASKYLQLTGGTLTGNLLFYNDKKIGWYKKGNSEFLFNMLSVNTHNELVFGFASRFESLTKIYGKGVNIYDGENSIIEVRSTGLTCYGGIAANGIADLSIT